MDNKDQEEEIVGILEGIRSLTHQSLSLLLQKAKTAAFDGDMKSCIRISRSALYQVEMSNSLIKNLLVDRNRVEWAILEDAEGYIHEQKVEAIFCDLITTSIGISTMKDRNIEA